MAEIKVEKKKYTWLWVLIAVLVVGIIIYFVASDNDTPVQTSPGMDVSITQEATDLAFVQGQTYQL